MNTKVTSAENNKRIAKNTLLLYFRMLITMTITLYTSRIVINTLGVSDYGLYNVVGGIVMMLSFINAGMTASSQRFISYELGKGDNQELKKVFITSINIHIAIALIAFILAETIGLWFVNTQLNIESARMNAANWVYQCSILTFMINVISVPYNSCIIAHEKMSAFAYISIVDVILKLLIVYLILISPFDRLIVYAILLLFVSIIIRNCYSIYCKRHFEECTYHLVIDRSLFKKMFSFAGWSVIGNIGFTFKDQASNILLNIFYGTTLNAARGIGIQVSGVAKTFAGNFTMALNPQITKHYSSGNIEESQKLVYVGSRYTFYLQLLISLPIIVNARYILQLWLGIVPEYTTYFLVLSLVSALLYTVSQCVTTAIQATGNIKVFQIGICVLLMSELPVAYLLLENGYPPYSVMYPTILSYTIAIFFRFYLIKKYVPNYSFRAYIRKVLLPCSIVLFISGAVAYLIKFYFYEDNWINLLIVSFSVILVTAVIIYMLGMDIDERKFILMQLNKFVKKVI